MPRRGSAPSRTYGKERKERKERKRERNVKRSPDVVVGVQMRYRHK
jgi:hypothetical protein